jgi:hypothetical protein
VRLTVGVVYFFEGRTNATIHKAAVRNHLCAVLRVSNSRLGKFDLWQMMIRIYRDPCDTAVLALSFQPSVRQCRLDPVSTALETEQGYSREYFSAHCKAQPKMYFST